MTSCFLKAFSFAPQPLAVYLATNQTLLLLPYRPCVFSFADMLAIFFAHSSILLFRSSTLEEFFSFLKYILRNSFSESLLAGNSLGVFFFMKMSLFHSDS